MKLRTIIMLLAILLLLQVPATLAQTPTVKVYFDQQFTTDYGHCPDAPTGTQRDTLYVVAEGFNIWMNAIEYQINYPPSILVLADWTDDLALTLGSSSAGIWIAWTIPQDANVPLLLQRVLFVWQCDNCSGIAETLDVVPFPHSGYIRAVRWPDNEPVIGTGSTAGICMVPPREATWGRIKALYD